MWNQPYLETCCRAALHRLALCGRMGRPADQKDGPCLRRLSGQTLARELLNGRYEITEAGLTRHANEVLKLTRVNER